MNIKKITFVTIVFVCLLTIFSINLLNSKTVRAETLSENVNEQINNIDFTKLESLSYDLEQGENSFLFNFNKIINGNYSVNYESFFEYVKNTIINNTLDFMPTLVTILAISVFSSLINSSKSVVNSEGVASIINLVCYLTVVLLLSTKIFSYFSNAKIIIENISKINEIMSPIIITLMIASGGTISASIYKPTVTFFTNGIVNLILLVVFPLISLTLIFGVISVFSKTIKLNKFVDFFSSTIKWIIGLTITIFGLFLSVQGITGAMHDGISIKAAKYAISNSVPLVGGFLRDTFDLTVAGSVLIKNAVGISSIIILINYIITPVVEIAVFSLVLKLASAFTECISDNKTTELCGYVSKSLTFLNAVILLTGFMLFITILLMIFSANAFI